MCRGGSISSSTINQESSMISRMTILVNRVHCWTFKGTSRLLGITLKV